MYACGHIRVTSPATATILKGKSVTKWSNGTTVGHVNDETQQTVDFWNQSTHPHSSEASRLVNIELTIDKEHDACPSLHLHLHGYPKTLVPLLVVY